MLLMFSLLPLLSGCDNEDDVIGIFTGKPWKLSRLANKDSTDSSIPVYGKTKRLKEKAETSLK